MRRATTRRTTGLPKRSYGWRPDLPDFRDSMYATVAAPPPTLPPRIDLRPLCSPVEDQGPLGSCTANALVGNLEFLEKKAGRPPTDLSRLFVYYNERAIEGTTQQDSGAMIRDGVKSLVSQGVCAESAWPYHLGYFAAKPFASCYTAAKAHCVTSYHRVVGLLQVRMCLAEGYPVVFGFSIYDSFESAAVAKSGVMPMPRRGERMLGGHAVCAVGYDDPSSRLIVRNSWGTGWGQAGYFTMPYGVVADGNMSDDFWTLRAFPAC